MAYIYFVSCLVTLVLLSTVLAKDPCKLNARCMLLKDCKELYKRKLQGLNIDNFLKAMGCGYDMEQPKICCPPGFENEFREEDPVNLLPDISTCGIRNSDRIVGGTQTDIDEHPWLALIRYDGSKEFGYYCGGVLISSRYVLTAAHCVGGAEIPKNKKITSVRLGEWNTSSVKDCYLNECSPPVVDVPIEEIIEHENYYPSDEHYQNDIALLRLKEEVQFSDFVKPICLPLSPEIRNMTFDGLNLEVAGWGETESGIASNIKLKLSLPVKSNKDCAAVYKRVERFISKDQLCAGGLFREDTCKGDSGGPLMGQVNDYKNWMVLGVVSYGPTLCGTPGWPGIYTRVTRYVDWILSNIRP